MIIEKDDFVKSLEKNFSDKEKFRFFSDEINFYNNYEPIGVSCLSCGYSNHHFYNCPDLFYIPTMTEILQKSKKLYKDRRKKFLKYKSLFNHKKY